MVCLNVFGLCCCCDLPPPVPGLLIYRAISSPSFQRQIFTVDADWILAQTDNDVLVFDSSNTELYFPYLPDTDYGGSTPYGQILGGTKSDPVLNDFVYLAVQTGLLETHRTTEIGYTPPPFPGTFPAGSNNATVTVDPDTGDIYHAILVGTNNWIDGASGRGIALYKLTNPGIGTNAIDHAVVHDDIGKLMDFVSGVRVNISKTSGNSTCVVKNNSGVDLTNSCAGTDPFGFGTHGYTYYNNTDIICPPSFFAPGNYAELTDAGRRLINWFDEPLTAYGTYTGSAPTNTSISGTMPPSGYSSAGFRFISVGSMSASGGNWSRTFKRDPTDGTRFNAMTLRPHAIAIKGGYLYALVTSAYTVLSTPVGPTYSWGWQPFSILKVDLATGDAVSKVEITNPANDKRVTISPTNGIHQCSMAWRGDDLWVMIRECYEANISGSGAPSNVTSTYARLMIVDPETGLYSRYWQVPKVDIQAFGVLLP